MAEHAVGRNPVPRPCDLPQNIGLDAGEFDRAVRDKPLLVQCLVRIRRVCRCRPRKIHLLPRRIRLAPEDGSPCPIEGVEGAVFVLQPFAECGVIGIRISEVWLFTLAQQRSRVEQALETLRRLSEAFESANEPAISAVLYEALAALLHDTGRHRRLAGSGAREKMFDVADYIRANCAGKLNLTSIADKAGYSPYHFTRIFRDAVGKSPTHYLTECRILLAKNLLVSTPLAIKQIAYETGFSQTSYFISIFHRMTGMTPQQFRDLYR